MKKTGYIAIIGKPNAGKSTLLNKIIGSDLSITSSKVQTTREKIIGLYTTAEYQMVFLDTPGLHASTQKGLYTYMMQQAEEAIADANLIWLLIDPMDPQMLEKAFSQPVFCIVNKIDVSKKHAPLVEKLKESGKYQHVFSISAKTGQGIQNLIDASKEYMPIGPFLYPDQDQLSDRPTRFFVQEKIRRQLYLKLGAELPYCTAVAIQSFQVKENITVISANIYVEKESQKSIVIGAKGLKIKEIGQSAREEIEVFLNTKVYLELFVKVKKNWTKKENPLAEIVI